MHYDGAAVGLVIDAGLQPFETEGEAMLTHIGFTGAVETQAALQGFIAVGKFPGVFAAGATAVGYIGIHHNGIVFDIDQVESFLPDGLRKITDRQVFRFGNAVLLEQVHIAFVGIFKSFFGKAFLIQLKGIVEYSRAVKDSGFGIQVQYSSWFRVLRSVQRHRSEAGREERSTKSNSIRKELFHG